VRPHRSLPQGCCLLSAARDRYLQAGNLKAVAGVSGRLGDSLRALRDYRGAEAMCRKALSGYVRLGDARGRAMALRALALVYEETGRPALAAAARSLIVERDRA
jgi:Tetratricopeptide repeat